MLEASMISIQRSGKDDFVDVRQSPGVKGVQLHHCREVLVQFRLVNDEKYILWTFESAVNTRFWNEQKLQTMGS